MRALEESEIPVEILVGADRWMILFVEKVDEQDNSGECNPHTHVIKIKKGLSGTERMRTLIHELFHAVEDSWARPIPHQTIYMLELAVWQILKEGFDGQESEQREAACSCKADRGGEVSEGG